MPGLKWHEGLAFFAQKRQSPGFEGLAPLTIFNIFLILLIISDIHGFCKSDCHLGATRTFGLAGNTAAPGFAATIRANCGGW
jgi:hypothetical protein